MEDSRQDRNYESGQNVNTDAAATGDNHQAADKVSGATRHTWIGDADEVRTDQSRTVTRATFVDVNERTTRVMERQRRPYQGFITDEEVKDAERSAEEFRKTRVMRDAAARKALAETRIYEGLGTGLGTDGEPGDAANLNVGNKDNSGKRGTSARGAEGKKKEKVSRPPREKKYFTINIADGRKRKGAIAVAVVFALLLVFEISFAFMKTRTAALPAETQQLVEQTTEMQKENEDLQSQADELGDPEQISANKESWERIKETLEN